MPQQSWDEHGNPIAASDSPTQSWDEQGKPIAAVAQSAPNPIANAASHAGSRLAEIPGAIGNMIAHPIDTATNIYQQGKQLAGEGIDAAKAGDYPLAAARAIETVMPGVGPAIAGGFRTIKSGDTSGGVGDIIGGAVIPAALPALSRIPVPPVVRAAVKGGIRGGMAPAEMGALKIPVPASIAGGYAGHFLGPVGSIVGAAAPIVRGAIQGGKEALRADWPSPISDPVRPNPAVAARMRFGGPVNTSGGPSYSGVGMSGAPAVEPITTPSFAPNKVNPNIARNLRFSPASDSGGTAASAIPSRVAGTPAADLPPLRPIPPSGSTPPAYAGPNRVNPSIAKNLRFTPGETQGGAASPATLGTRAEMMRQVRLRQQGIVAPDQSVTAIEPRTFANGGIKLNTRRTN